MYSLNKKNGIHILTLVSIFIFILLSTCQFFVGVGTRAVSTFTPAGGSGTSASPYLIANQTQLNSLAGYVNSGGSTSGKYYKLTENITLSGNHTPIGNSSYKFQGNFDGDGHSIDSLNITGTASTALGFFGYINGATIKNVYLKSGTISNTYDSGALVGSATGSITIENCRNYGVTVRYPSSGTGTGQMGLGGLIGWANTATGTISCCCNLATVQNYAINPYAGGIVGKYGGSITKCYNKGKVYSGSLSTSATSFGGGICGYTSGTITDCFNAASVDAYALSVESDGASGTNYTLKKTTIPAYAGGICGGGASSISRCYNTGTINGGSVKNVYTLNCEVASASHNETWSAHGYSGANRYSWKEILTGTIKLYYKINYDEIQPGIKVSNCYSANKFASTRQDISISLSSKMIYKYSISGSVYNPADTLELDTEYSYSKNSSTYLSNFKIDGASPKGITSKVVSDLNGTTRSKQYNVVPSLTYTVNHSAGTLSMVASYTLKTSYSSSTNQSLTIMSVSLDKALGFTVVNSDADIKSQNMGSAWAVSSKINNGYPHLKSMYWEDNALTPT